MKKCIVYLATFICFASYQLEATANDRLHGVYLQAIGGLNFIDVPSKDSVSIDLYPGYYIGGSVGYRFALPLRLELEIAYRDNKFDTLTVDGMEASLEGHYRSWTYTGNVLCDLPRLRCMYPYIGAGIGGKQSEGTMNVDNGIVYLEDEALIWQGITGLSFEFFEKGDFRLEYHYLNDRDETNHAIGLTVQSHF